MTAVNVKRDIVNTICGYGGLKKYREIQFKIVFKSVPRIQSSGLFRELTRSNLQHFT